MTVLPPDAERQLIRMRSLEPPVDLVDSIMAEVEATRRSVQVRTSARSPGSCWLRPPCFWQWRSSCASGRPTSGLRRPRFRSTSSLRRGRSRPEYPLTPATCPLAVSEPGHAVPI